MNSVARFVVGSESFSLAAFSALDEFYFLQWIVPLLHSGTFITFFGKGRELYSQQMPGRADEFFAKEFWVKCKDAYAKG